MIINIVFKSAIAFNFFLCLKKKNAIVSSSSKSIELIIFFLLALKLSLSSDNMVNNHNHIRVSDQIYSGV